MFARPTLIVVFLLASSSVFVESVKTGGSNIVHHDHSLAKITTRNRLAKVSGCFFEFSDNQADTVKKMGKDWDVCEDIESMSNAAMNEDLKAFSYNIAKVPNDICVKIDNDCRNKFAEDGDIIGALDCYTELPIPARSMILEMGQDCKLKLLNVENESRLIVATKKNCTKTANFEYLKTSDLLFENLITTCENAPPESSTTLSTTQSTTQLPIQPTTQHSTIKEDSSSTWYTQPASTKGRFPWN